MENFKRFVQIIWPFVKKYRVSFYALTLFYSFGQVLAGSIIPLIYKEIIDTINRPEAKEFLWIDLQTSFILLALSVLIYNSFYRISDYIISYFQTQVIRELNNFSFQSILKHSLHFFGNTFSGSLVSKARRFSRAFEEIHDQLTFQFLFSIVQIIGICIILSFTSFLLSGVFIIWSCLYIIVVSVRTKQQLKLNTKEAAMDSHLTGKFADAFGNVLNIISFSKKRYEEKEFSNTTLKQSKALQDCWHFQNKTYLYQGLLAAILEIVGMYTVLILWKNDIASTGTVVLMQIYIGKLIDKLWNLGKAITRITRETSNATEMIEIIDSVPSIEDPKKAEKCKIKKGEISLNNITFSYENKEKIFKKFTLKIPAGQKIGVVGHSGAGKSSLAKIIMRFWDVEQGSVCIDSQNIQHITQDDLHNQIAFVSQEPLLFHRSLKENILYGNQNASKDELIQATKKAFAYDFISKLPQGFDTLVGERGVKLSGGEKQRVAIARAILKNAPILILDEATSSLDSQSEQYIQKALEELMKDKTVIAIAHRLSTLQKMDRIIVVEKGGIVQDGTHNQLIQEAGIYKTLWDHQVNGFVREI